MASMWPESEKTQELIANAREGDGDALERLLERHRDAVVRLVAMRLDHRVRRRVDVSDVVQDVMIEANRRLTEYLSKPPMPFHLWLRQIARDRIIDTHRRHRGSAKRNIDREQPVNVAAGDRSTFDLVAQLCDQELTPAAAATQKELAQRVEEAITRLEDQDCEIILMRHYEQLTNQEAATALGLTAPAASMRYLRAIRRLRELLDLGTKG